MSKVSIVVPVHNTAMYVRRCIESLQNQTLQDIEIILVENGSTDSSLEICNSYAKDDKRIKVIHLDKGDVSVARNIGVDAASSDYIGFLDSDDAAEIDMFEVLYSIAAEHDLDIMYSNFVDCYDNGEVKYRYPNDGGLILTDTKGLLSLHFLHKLPARVCTFIVKNNIMREVAFPEKTYYEDRAISHMVVAKCNKGGYVRRALMRYYHREGSTAHVWSWKHYNDFCAAEKGRLQYLHESTMFSNDEKKRLAKMPSDWMLRKMRYLRKASKTNEQKLAFREMTLALNLIPAGCKLSLKTKTIKWVFNRLYKK